MASPSVFAPGLATPNFKNLKNVHKELVDTVDQLTKNEVDKIVDLPQIIVVGDQSAGKSSVLESISHVRFPSDKSLCTRFATQLVLSEADEFSMVVTIIPDENTNEEERSQLGLFRLTQEGHPDLTPIIIQATEAMGLNSSNNNGPLFSMHTLRVEASGPKMPRLTLVDLPGFYSGRSNDQSDDYREVPVKIARKYMNQKNILILMVVSADITTNKQAVTSEVRRADEHGERTLGIITKPDLAQRDFIGQFVGYLKNEPGTDMFLEHGWHVVRNRASDEPLDFKSRDSKEALELKKKPWGSFSSQDKGIVSLREKLTSALVNLVASEMPRVIQTLNDLRTEKQAYRDSFRDRSSYTGIEIYLNQVQRRFSQLATQAVRGQLDDPEFFMHANQDMPDDKVIQKRNLRGRIRKNNREFVDAIHLCGSLNVFEWGESISKYQTKAEPQTEAGSQTEAQPKPEERPVSRYMTKIQFKPEDLQLINKYGNKQPTPLTQDQLVGMIIKKAELYEGMEMPGSIHQGLTLRMFRDQSKPWKSLAQIYIDNCVGIVEDVIMDILKHVTLADKVLGERINQKFIRPFIQKRKEVLSSKLNELLPSKDPNSFPIALENIFVEKVTARGFERINEQVLFFQREYAHAMSPGFELALKSANYGQAVLDVRHGTKNGSEIPRLIESLVDYYEMTLDTFVTNLIILGNENQLMVQIPEVFTMEKIISLGKEGIRELGAEPSNIKQRRETVEKELEQLDKGIELCEKWNCDDIFTQPKENGVSDLTE